MYFYSVFQLNLLSLDRSVDSNDMINSNGNQTFKKMVIRNLIHGKKIKILFIEEIKSFMPMLKLNSNLNVRRNGTENN